VSFDVLARLSAGVARTAIVAAGERIDAPALQNLVRAEVARLQCLSGRIVFEKPLEAGVFEQRFKVAAVMIMRNDAT